MHSTFANLLSRYGQSLKVERNGVLINSYSGMFSHESSTGRPYIGFLPNCDIKPKDWVINSSGEKFYIKDALTQSFAGKPNELKAFYLTQVEFADEQNNTSTVFNIEKAYGSVIGTQSNVTLNYQSCLDDVRGQIENSDSDDKAELFQIIDLLETIVNNQVAPTKGLFSKFSNAMERNSWITSPIASALLSWLVLPK